MTIKKVGVLGCGLMGSGIAQVSATAGFDVISLEVDEKYIERGFAGIRKSLEKLASKGKLGEPVDAILARLKGTTRKEDLADCDIIVEAIIENLAEKRKMFAALDPIVKPEAIFASNTSSISITETMTATRRADRFVGMHFFNPVPLMNLVEVARTIVTSPEVLDTVCEFGKKLGKTPVRTNDMPGFIVNRLLVPYLLDAVRAFEEGVGSVSDIDASMKLGCGYPMGPFTLLDFVGLDTTYYISIVMFDEFKEKRFASPSLLKRMVLAGWHGKKSGKGFYDWADPNAPVPQDAALRGLHKA
ncbi:MAG: 3-hydroxyacyl-CoA dehydrogenase family protein [Acidobacteriia bacterium]|nr:3-hydroxyacyl-CoA dehydrogenase family protein [Terriglobia bacterium]